MIAKRVLNPDGSLYGIRFECPGCELPHVVPVKPHAHGWVFNGDFDSPSLSPSLLVHPHGIMLADGSVGQSPLCHSFIRDGKIQFLGDCTHKLANKTVDLPEIKP